MYFKQFIADDLGCASYLIGDTGAGECVVVDPKWNVADYIEVAAGKGMRIAYVIETHNHADHISGHGKLAALGARVAVYESAGVEYPHLALKDGDSISVGSVRLQAIHTPGHRPEHIAIAVSDLSRTDEPWLVLTGDSLFVGDVGRPDLAIEPGEGAAQLYHSLRARLLILGDEVEVYPGHVAGSLCGKAMSDKGSSTIGFERRWNPALRARKEATFVKSVTAELPAQPPQFARIVARNRGPFLTDEIEAGPIPADEVARMREQNASILDTRSPQAFGGGHIPGAFNVYLHGGQFATRASWVLPVGKPFILVLETADELHTTLERLAMSGQDGVCGYLLGGMGAWESSGLPLETILQVSAEQLKERLDTQDNDLAVLDVREQSEWREGHIPGAIHVPFHALKDHLGELPKGRTLATICGSGIRSSIAAGILQAHGYNPVNVAGGMDAWRAMDGPLS
ncbi:MAG: rhodanese-like domain-containing protein [Chloroflexia bacterium]